MKSFEKSKVALDTAMLPTFRLRPDAVDAEVELALTARYWRSVSFETVLPSIIEKREDGLRSSSWNCDQKWLFGTAEASELKRVAAIASLRKLTASYAV